jgi:NAD(P)-dependent dehydrogenase (short-subunit alcohol dehydrogenase family)
LITGSEGHLGRALRAAFEEQGDEVVGVDLPRTGAEIECDLNADPDRSAWSPDSYAVVVCNAKTYNWEWHHRLGRRATSSIINIGSIYGSLGSDPSIYKGTEVEPTPAHYAASKGALVALTKWQATNLQPVRSNCVCPGGIFRGHSDTFRERYERKVPLGRMATEADIVPLVLFLADPIRAAYITGQCIMVDGGLSAW